MNNQEEDFADILRKNFLKMLQLLEYTNGSFLEKSNRQKIDEKNAMYQFTQSLLRILQSYSNVMSKQLIDCAMKQIQNPMLQDKQTTILNTEKSQKINQGQSIMVHRGQQINTLSNNNVNGKGGANENQANQDEGARYCLCQTIYKEGNSMIECEYCSQWFHFECIGYSSTKEQADLLTFICVKCLQQIEDHDRKFQIIGEYFEFFTKSSEMYITYKNILNRAEKKREIKNRVKKNQSNNILPQANDKTQKPISMAIKMKEVWTQNSFKTKKYKKSQRRFLQKYQQVNEDDN